MFDYRLVEAFAAVLEERGFARAAERLCITQSAVSQRIKQLEDQLGRILVLRESPPRATKAGERLLRHYRQVHGLEEEALLDLGIQEAGKFRHLPIAVNADCLSVWLLDAIAPYLREAAITLEIFVDDQDNNLHGRAFNGLDVFRLKETIDTTYYGGYVGLGGEYSLGFLGTGGLMDRLGLRTFVSARAGLYEASTDYDGRFAYLFVPFSSKLSKSNDDLAFIGTLSFEARKDLGPHTSIGLYTDYEYISSVPKIKYADLDGTTRIEDEGEFASRTMLRFNYTWGGQPGPAPIYGEPLK